MCHFISKSTSTEFHFSEISNKLVMTNVSLDELFSKDNSKTKSSGSNSKRTKVKKSNFQNLYLDYY